MALQRERSLYFECPKITEHKTPWNNIKWVNNLTNNLTKNILPYDSLNKQLQQRQQLNLVPISRPLKQISTFSSSPPRLVWAIIVPSNGNDMIIEQSFFILIKVEFCLISYEHKMKLEQIKCFVKINRILNISDNVYNKDKLLSGPPLFTNRAPTQGFLMLSYWLLSNRHKLIRTAVKTYLNNSYSSTRS